MRFWNKETFIALVGVGLSSICMSIGFSRSVEWFMLVHAAIVSFVFIGVFLLLNYVSAWIGDRLEARRRADRELKFAQEREMRKQEEKKRLAAIDPRKSSTAKNDYKNKLIADAEGRYAAMSRDLEAIDREIEHIEALPLDCRCDPRDWGGFVGDICNDYKDEVDYPGQCRRCEHQRECHRDESDG